MSSPILCYVTDRKVFASPEDPAKRISLLLQRIEEAAKAGVDWIQIREKDLEARDILQIATVAVDLTSAAKTQVRSRVLINDRVDVANAAGADGVHLGGNSVPVETMGVWRQECDRKDFMIGASCHSINEARRREDEGADYVFFGPVFNTPSKERFGPPQGLQELAEVCRALKIPVLAIGGMNAGNARSCLDAGASGIAAIRLFQDSSDLAALTAKLRT